MNRSIALSVDNGDPVEIIRDFLKKLLDRKVVDGLLVPLMLPGGTGLVQTLVRDPSMLGQANPVSPTIAVQSARILTDLTAGPLGKERLGVVLKSCEMRAAVELLKFLQIKKDNLITIGIDCPGTCEVKDYAAMAGTGLKIPEPIFWEGIKTGEIRPPEGFPLRPACEICEYPAASETDITIGFIGYDPLKEILLMVSPDFEAELTGKIPIDFTDEPLNNRDKIIEKITASRKKTRNEALTEMRSRTGSLEEFLQVFSTCILCRNCSKVCPVCYCRECVFDSDIFEHTGRGYLNQAERKGAVRMPADTLIFHLTRLSHMATSCVGCGLCESACPNELPVSTLFTLAGRDLQGMFDYLPGRSLDEKPPVSDFRENELQAETGSSD